MALATGLALSACGPAAAPSMGDTSGSTTTGPAGTDASSTSAAAESSGQSSSSGGEASSSSGGAEIDPCLASSWEDCAPPCSVVTAYAANDDTCGIGAKAHPLCVSLGEPLGDGTRTTYYAEIDGELLYLLTGQGCVDMLPAGPVHWTECTGAPDESAQCQCLCGANGCPWEADLLLLQACGLDQPCGEPEVNSTEQNVCTLTALRDRTPGAYASLFEVFPQADDSHVFFESEDMVQLVHRAPDDLFCSPLGGVWEPTLSCTLKPPSYFDACLQAVEPSEQYDCAHGSNWVENCVEMPATCP